MIERMDFTAIDFETATHARDSACQLAAVRVRRGEIVHRKCWLIRPRPFHFSRSNIAIHGIHPADVANELEFGDQWPEMAATIGEDTILAHNASFDMGVLLACLNSHDLPTPELEYSCTRAIGRRVWPQLPRFGLKPLASWLGIEFRHHDALEDSIACAKIAIAAAAKLQVDGLEELESAIGLKRGRAGAWGKRGLTDRRSGRPRIGPTACAATTERSPKTTPGTSNSPARMDPDVQRLMIRAEFIQPLAGRRIAFAGRLQRFKRNDAVAIAERGGGTCQSRVCGTTDFLVVGKVHSRKSAGGRVVSNQETKAQQLRADGQEIRVLTEDDFILLLGTGTADIEPTSHSARP
ncbi:MAG: exonuclease domain-containing protein [Planctomycetota bacterium]